MGFYPWLKMQVELENDIVDTLPSESSAKRSHILGISTCVLSESSSPQQLSSFFWKG
jgi:hypothetical protein